MSVSGYILSREKMIEIITKCIKEGVNADCKNCKMEGVDTSFCNDIGKLEKFIGTEIVEE